MFHKKRFIGLLIFSVMILAMTGCSKSAKENEGSTAKTDETGNIVLPYEIPDSGITVNSLFTSSVPNPDCDDEVAEDIATLEITNTSDKFIEQAEITATLKDGTELSFEITDFPSGKTADIFEVNNETLSSDAVCTVFTADTSFGESSMMEDAIAVTVDGTSITLMNVSDKDIEPLNIYCHTLLDEAYFGGRVYQYETEAIPAGESIIVDATDCYFGNAEVVRIESK